MATKRSKVPARMAPPFTSRDLLDQTYGYFQRIGTQKQLRCTCGKQVFAVSNATLAVECLNCRGSLLAMSGMDTVSLEQAIKGMNCFSLQGDFFEFFANRWWKCDARLNRLHPVKNRERIAELDIRRNGKPPKPVPPPAKLQSYSRVAPGGYKRGGGEKFLAACQCSSLEAHVAFADRPRLLDAFCPRHSGVCGTCGEDHSVE